MPFDPALFEEIRVSGNLDLTANWNENEYLELDLHAPGGAIICGVNFTEISRTSASWHWRKMNTRTVHVVLKARGSHAITDQWRGWVELHYELICYKRKNGVDDSIEIECPVVDGPDAGGTYGHEAEGVDTYCMHIPGEAVGTLMCMPYYFKDGKKVLLPVYACGLCYKND